jgi:uncharacterized membrane protein
VSVPWRSLASTGAWVLATLSLATVAVAVLEDPIGVPNASAVYLVSVVVCGFATFLVGLAVALPVLAYATWHAYRDLIAAEDSLAREPVAAQA